MLIFVQSLTINFTIMKIKILILLLSLMSTAAAFPQEETRYIEVTGTSEIEIVPQRIHYIIRIKEYFAEEFDGKSKPEKYQTKVPISGIENELRQALDKAGIPDGNIRTQEIGEYWRERGQDFLLAKEFDITLNDFSQIDEIVRHISASTKGIQSMNIGTLENDDILSYHRRGKIEALNAARQKAAYLVESLGKKLGDVISIVEENQPNRYVTPQSNIVVSDARSFENYRTIRKSYSIKARFEISD